VSDALETNSFSATTVEMPPELQKVSIEVKKSSNGLSFDSLCTLFHNVVKTTYHDLSKIVTQGGDLFCRCRSKKNNIIVCSTNCKCRKANAYCNSSCHSGNSDTCNNKHEQTNTKI
jgi:hypothetical protein